MHGVATATACALLGLPCVVYMGEEDTRRQAPNVSRMQLLGAEVVPVTAGSRTLKEAVNEALRDWAASRADHALHHRLGRGTASVPGARPRPPARDRRRGPTAVRGASGGADPDVVAACVGGGSNAIGMFTAFVGAPGVRLIGVEAGGRGTTWASTARPSPWASRASSTAPELPAAGRRRPGRRARTRSPPGSTTRASGPEHAYLRDAGLAEYVSASDEDALEGFQALARSEGIIPALEPAHVIGWLLHRPLPRGHPVLVCLSGRGDKDLDTVRASLGIA